MMNSRSAILLIGGAALLFALWEAAGHLFLMNAPMGLRHITSAGVGLALALVITFLAVHTLIKQDREIRELARIKDYLLKMESHYRRLDTGAPIKPQDYLLVQALETRFGESQRKFINSDDPAVRVKAIMDLTELGVTRRPGGNSDVTTEAYPYFVRSVCRLAAALYLEQNPTVQSEVVHSIEKLARFSWEVDRAMLGSLIEEVAHANRMAMGQFSSSLADYLCMETRSTREVVASLAPLLPIPDDETASAVLRSLTAERAFAESIELRRKYRTEEVPAARIDAVKAAATCLRLSRDALAACISHLRFLAQAPPATGSARERRAPLDLHGVLLAGANLEDMDLRGANLKETYLQGARLFGAHLESAEMDGARFQGAMMQNTCLRRAKLRNANLRRAGLSGGNLEEADLRGADAAGAFLLDANLRGAFLWRTTFTAEGDDEVKPADLTGANWWEAVFTDPISETEDRKLVGWLRGSFPPQKDRKADSAAHA